MKTLLKICLLMAFISLFNGCANKEKQIPKTSPCACYDLVKVS